jgi:hypothetical protein
VHKFLKSRFFARKTAFFASISSILTYLQRFTGIRTVMGFTGSLSNLTQGVVTLCNNPLRAKT